MSTPDYSVSTIQIAVANTLAAVTLQAQQLNQQLTAAYMTRFNDWAGQVSSGRIDNTNPPRPPNAYVVSYFDDPTTGPGSNGPYQEHAIQWPYPVQGDKPVCEIPPVPQVAKAAVSPVLPEPDQVRNVPEGDTLPVGFIMTAPDGSRWQKHSSRTPFGVAYYYQRLA